MEANRAAGQADDMRVAIDAGEQDGEHLLVNPHAEGSPRHSAAPTAAVDPANQRFPFCIVWSPIPVLTWFLPFVGHLGIANSEG